MNLNLVSLDGLRITKARRWVLRCAGCFKLCLVRPPCFLHAAVSRMMCSRLRSRTSRSSFVSSVDSTRWRKSRTASTNKAASSYTFRDAHATSAAPLYVFPPSPRCRVLSPLQYPIPKPKGGRKHQDLIVSQGQMPRQQRAHKKEELLVNDELGRPSAAQSGPVFGYGKHNPNQARKKFGKKNKSKRRD